MPSRPSSNSVNTLSVPAMVEAWVVGLHTFKRPLRSMKKTRPSGATAISMGLTTVSSTCPSPSWSRSVSKMTLWNAPSTWGPEGFGPGLGSAASAARQAPRPRVVAVVSVRCRKGDSVRDMPDNPSQSRRGESLFRWQHGCRRQGAVQGAQRSRWPHWASCRSAWSMSVRAVMASTIGTARGSTQGS